MKMHLFESIATSDTRINAQKQQVVISLLKKSNKKYKHHNKI